MTLTFTPGNHRYRLDGKPVRSVTGILNAGIPKPALAYWAANETATAAITHLRRLKEQANDEDIAWALASTDLDVLYDDWRKAPWQQRDKAAMRGTEIHTLAEQLLAGEDVDVPLEHAAEVQAVADFLDDWDITPIHTEARVYSREPRWAGTLDLIATSPHMFNGRPFLADWKTSKSVHAETALQTAAYAMADAIADDMADTPMPHVEATAVFHITPDGVTPYSLATTRDEIEAHYAAFTRIYAALDKPTDTIIKEIQR